jgi:dihydroorotate dehydrogenase
VIDLYPIAGPLLRRLDPETAHGVTVAALKSGLAPRSRMRDDPILRSSVWGLDFANPVGLAAGFDKNAEVPDAMLGQGFGFVEIGSVTPRPQPGNPRPRAFRVPEAQALINRYGFNNDGLDVVAKRLEARRGRPGLVGANVGKNKETVDAAADYVIGIRRLAPLASYLVINVSSPNTPGLRALQGREPLAELLGRALDARTEGVPAGGAVPPLLLKIAPDLTEEDKRDIAEVALSSGIDGLIVSNTTLARPPELPADVAKETGGLSGAPLKAASTAVLADMYRLTGARIPLIGCGGVASGRDAYDKIRAGASLVQLYTALVYRGPRLVEEIRRDLATLLRADGFTGLRDAVGAGHRQGSS